MGLFSCPSCGLQLFDTDTSCIYCGWQMEAAPAQPEPEVQQKAEEIAELESVLEKRIDELKKPEESTISPEKVNAAGIRTINGVQFNFFKIVNKHTPANRIAIIKDVRAATNCDLKTAMNFVDEQIPRNMPQPRPAEQETPPVQSAADDRTEDKYSAAAYHTTATKQYKESQQLLFSLIDKHGADNITTILAEFTYITRIPSKDSKYLLAAALKEYVKK